jgi:hypothetical protein
VTDTAWEPPDPRVDQWSRAFSASVYDPAQTMQTRGFPTGQLMIRPGELHFRPSTLGTGVKAPELHYSYKAVLVERVPSSFLPVRWFHMTAIPVELHGGLGRLWVSGASRGRLVASLTAAGFHVVEVQRGRGEMPTPVPTSLLGDAAKQLPRAVQAGPAQARHAVACRVLAVTGPSLAAASADE